VCVIRAYRQAVPDREGINHNIWTVEMKRDSFRFVMNAGMAEFPLSTCLSSGTTEALID
jgi:hypothetical protein